MRDTFLRAAALAALTLLPTPAAAQGLQEQVADLKRALEENAAAQRGYTWIQTTQLKLNGEVKATESSTCQYEGGQAKPVCTLIGAPPEGPHVRGPVRKRIAKSKVADLKAYMDSVKTLVGDYIPLEPQRVQEAMQRGDVAIAPNPSNNTVKFTISNYRQQGDAVSVTIRQGTHQLVDLAVNSWLNDPSATVTLSVKFATLPNGVTFPVSKVVTASAKNIVVGIGSSNFAQAVAQ